MWAQEKQLLLQPPHTEWFQQDQREKIQKLKTLENWTQYLAPGRTQKELDDICLNRSATDFAEVMQKEKTKLFKNFKP